MTHKTTPQTPNQTNSNPPPQSNNNQQSTTINNQSNQQSTTVNNNQQSSPTKQKVLNFFQSFRKVYIGEQVMHTSSVYGRLGERAGVGDHLAVLAKMLAKLATNLRAYGRSEQLVHLTLQLFQVRWRCVVF